MNLRRSYTDLHLPVRISVLQRVDRWIGIPLCAILTFVKLLLEPRIRAFSHQVQRILFIKFAEQGSTVLAYPLIRRAVKMVGRDNVYFIVFEESRFILDMMEILPSKNIITVATN